MNTPLKSLLEEKGRTIHSVTPGHTVLAAVEKMNAEHIGALMVLDDSRPVGIFTERDVLRAVVGAQRDPASTSVGDLMTRDLIVVSPDCTVEEAMRVVTSKRCRHLPVMDGEKLAGVISSGDLTRWMTRSQENEIESLISYIHGDHPAS